jgi:hypothetical protein
VISGVADRIPGRIGALVYLDAFVLEDGRCLHDDLPPEHRKAQLEAARLHGDGWKVPPIPAAGFNVNSKDAAWVDRQCTMQPLATFQQPLRLTGKLDAVKNVTFIRATGYDESPFTPSYQRAKSKGWKTLTMACGHDVMLDMPQELTQYLLAVSP